MATFVFNGTTNVVASGFDVDDDQVVFDLDVAEVASVADSPNGAVVTSVSGATLTFPGLSKHSYNLSGYYDDGTISARLSYNWRSRFLIAALDRGNNPAVGEPFGQWDASASATLTDNVSVFLEGVNVFNAQRTENAASIYRRNIIETYGRRVYGGVRVKF